MEGPGLQRGQLCAPWGSLARRRLVRVIHHHHITTTIQHTNHCPPLFLHFASRCDAACRCAAMWCGICSSQSHPNLLHIQPNHRCGWGASVEGFLRVEGSLGRFDVRSDRRGHNDDPRHTSRTPLPPPLLGRVTSRAVRGRPRREGWRSTASARSPTIEREARDVRPSSPRRGAPLSARRAHAPPLIFSGGSTRSLLGRTRA